MTKQSVRMYWPLDKLSMLKWILSRQLLHRKSILKLWRKLSLRYSQQVLKIKTFDAARLAAKWDSIVVHNINIAMAKIASILWRKNMCNVNFRCVYNFREVRAGVVLILVLFRVVFFHFHSLSFLFWQKRIIPPRFVLFNNERSEKWESDDSPASSQWWIQSPRHSYRTFQPASERAGSASRLAAAHHR